MMELKDPLTYYQKQFNQLQDFDASWLNQLRTESFNHFIQQGFPHRKIENWKYTNVDSIAKTKFEFSNTSSSDVQSLLKQAIIPNLDAYQIVFINGYFYPAYSQLHLLPEGLTITNLYDQLKSPNQFIQDHLGKLNYQGHPFAALNTGFISDGLYLHIDSNTIINKPIHVIYISSAENETTINQPHNFIQLDSHAECSLIETYIGTSDHCYFTNTVTEIHLGENAKLDHCKLQYESLASYHIAGIHVNQTKNSTYTSHSFSFGGTLARNDIQTNLLSTGTQCNLFGFYLTNEKQHIDNHTIIDHQQPQGTSNEYYKGILNKNSHAVFNGKVIVQPNAQKSIAKQMNKNLLLDTSAEIDTKPELQIYADDVQCSHGATVGQMDETALFYLRSRGLDENIARQLLIYAFTSDIIDTLNIPELKSMIKHRIGVDLQAEPIFEELV